MSTDMTHTPFQIHASDSSSQPNGTHLGSRRGEGSGSADEGKADSSGLHGGDKAKVSGYYGRPLRHKNTHLALVEEESREDREVQLVGSLLFK